jgi:hypothetical protein
MCLIRRQGYSGKKGEDPVLINVQTMFFMSSFFVVLWWFNNNLKLTSHFARARAPV